MDEIRDQVRALFEQIAPPVDVERILTRPGEVSPRRGWVVAVAAAAVVACAGIGSYLLVGEPGTATGPGGTAGTSTTGGISSTASGVTTTTSTVVATEPQPLDPVRIECNSELADFPCAALVDGDTGTRWKAIDGGIGAEFVLTFEAPVEITSMVLRSPVDPAAFARNSRPRTITITTNTGERVVADLADAVSNTIDLALGAATQVHIGVTAVYEAESYAGLDPFGEMALAEVEVRGRLGEDQTESAGGPIALAPRSAECSAGGDPFPCDGLLDGDPATLWLAPDEGAGAEITLHFDPPVAIQSVALGLPGDSLGYAHVRGIEASADDLRDVTVAYLEHDEPVLVGSLATTQLTLRVLDVYSGESDELAISGIEVIGYSEQGSIEATGSQAGMPVGDPIEGTWASSRIPSDYQFQTLSDLAWLGDRFVALVDVNHVEHGLWQSTDGTSWARLGSLPWTSELGGPRHLAGGPGGFLLGGSADGRATIWHSVNGAAWVAIDLGSGSVRDVAVTGFGYVAVGTTQSPEVGGQMSGSMALWVSEDGISWSPVDLPSFDRPTSLVAILEVPGGTLAVGSELADADLLNFIPVILSSSTGRGWRPVSSIGLEAWQIDGAAAAGNAVALISLDVLWLGGDGGVWAPVPLDALASNRLGTLLPEAVGALGDLLVAVEAEVLNSGLALAVWFREPDGTWRAAEADPSIGFECFPVGVAAGGGKVVIACDEGDDPLSVRVFEIDDP